MERQSLADLEIAVLEPVELAALTSKLREYQEEQLSFIEGRLPFIGRYPTRELYGLAQGFDSFNDQLDLTTQREQLRGLNNALKSMKEVDPAYYELPLAQARIHLAVGMEADAALRGTEVSREDLEATRFFFQQAKKHSEEALALYQHLSQGWPEWRKGYSSLITAMSSSALCQEAMAILGLPQEPREDLAEYTIANATLAHSKYHDLFAKGIFITREEALKTLINYANALVIGMQEDMHLARGYLQAAQRELGNNPIIVKGLAFLDKQLEGKVC